METRLYKHEGTDLMYIEGEGAQPILAAAVICAVPGDGLGEIQLRWRVHGDPLHAVPAMARFLQTNPAFAMAVQGAMQMMVTGRLDGNPHHAPDCPQHGPQAEE